MKSQPISEPLTIEESVQLAPPLPSNLVPHYFFLLLGLLALVLPILPSLSPWLTVYDMRRAILVAVLFIGTAYCCTSRPSSFVAPIILPFTLFTSLGLISIFGIAVIPQYAALELSLFLSMTTCILLLGQTRLNERSIRSWLLPILAGSVVLYGIVTLINLAAGWAVEGNRPSWPEPLHNFINRRFLNDWQAWLLPLLPAALFSQIPRCHPWLHRSLTVAYFGFLWALLLYSLGRATLYTQLGGLLLIPILFGRRGLTWSGIQLATAFLGVLLLIGVLGMNPFAEGGAPTDRLLNLQSSGRIELWKVSIQVISENPLLGIGPMQFATLPQVIHAHPHNLILQIAAEWGIPAAILLIFSLSWAYWCWIRFSRSRILASACANWEAFLLMSLSASMAVAAANSLLAGTAHTPLSQFMLLLIVGCAYALYRQQHPLPADKKQNFLTRAWVVSALAFAVWFGGFTAYELSIYHGNKGENTDYAGGRWSPRYWRHGQLTAP